MTVEQENPVPVEPAQHVRIVAITHAPRSSPLQETTVTTPTPDPDPNDANAGEAATSGEIFFQKALGLHLRGELAGAEAVYREVLRREPDNPDCQHLLGLALHQTGRSKDAEALLRKAVENQPGAAEFHNSLGAVLIALERSDEASAALESALKIEPGLSDAHYNLGYIDHSMGRLREALGRYKHALDCNPSHVPATINWGSILMNQDRPDEAGLMFQRALQHEPRSLPALSSLARVYRVKGNLEASANLLRQAIEIAPDDAYGHSELALTLLLAGDFKQGFEEYEWRARGSGTSPRSFAQALWDGKKFGGKTILLHGAHEPAEAIQFVRYAGLVAARGGRVVIECAPALKRLLKTMPGVAEVTAMGEALPEFDLHIPIEMLPRLFGTTPETIPSAFPYLSAPKGQVLPFQPVAGSKYQIGVVWRCRSASSDQGAKNFPLAYLLDLATQPGIAIVSLQIGATTEEQELLAQHHITHIGDRLGDYADTAAAISKLDLVISVESPEAHLAGALAHPVWLILGAAADWRWPEGSNGSPWYPTMRVFRQDQAGDWSGVTRMLPEALAAGLGESPNRQPANR